jgi:heme exporter protein C
MSTSTIVKKGLFVVSAAMMLVVLYLIFIWVPTERNLGVSQRIFYFHVPIAWVAFLAFFIVLVGSVGYLGLGRLRWLTRFVSADGWDRLAYSAAELGVLFTTLMLVTGILWAKPVWGVWWTWDPRLTTSLILWLIYVGYLMLRAYSPPGDQGARYAAVLGIVGFIDVPIVYLSIVWWRTVHPLAIVGPAATKGALDPAMYMLLMISTVMFTVLFTYLLIERVSLRKTEDEVELARGITESLR